METPARANAPSEMGEQYSLGRILGIWALAAVPMGILSWIIFPAVSPDFNSDPLEFGVTRIVLLALGLVWLFVLSMIIVSSRGRRLALGDGQEEAPAQRPAGSSDRPTPRKTLVVCGAVHCRGRGDRTRTEHSIRKRLGVGISVSCRAQRL